MQEFALDNRLVSLPDADHRFPRIFSLVEDAPHIRMQVDVSQDLCWFRGHFPKQPVLPGIVQLHWAVIIVQACFGFSAVPTEIKRLKFKKVVTPPHIFELSVSRKSGNEAQFEYHTGSEQNSEGRLVFAETAPC
ncbi:MAG: hypothetical protein OER22_05260 [Gammaproteobacteria bacterium]|nr:hypothetical protein [Gammaproteobacteria bacterium]MDH3372033.1 hypothetical protein [Gammaproteobacteria bacterium]MDH3407830.1 hypothetical protein [Gammaproteobacteria bacterium]MDH3552005.1 hypothetical protein [Gammaproteobacteria bacterium]